MKGAIVRVASKCMLDAIGFPEGTRVVAARVDLFNSGCVELVVEHDDLPDSPEGFTIPVVNPLFEEVRSLNRFVSWGIDGK